MGAPKAHLPFGSATLIETVVATLRPVFKTVYVVGHRRNQRARRYYITVTLSTGAAAGQKGEKVLGF